MDLKAAAILLVGLVAIPVLLGTGSGSFSQVFSPRGVIYSDELAPIFLAPLARPESLATGLSRLIQCGTLALIDDPKRALIGSWGGWVILAVIRTGTGYLLSRSVGWAYPALFSHYALYESSTGLGAALIAYLIAFDPLVKALDISALSQWSTRTWATPAAVAVMCWLECRPWTYGTALVFAYPSGWILRWRTSRKILPGPVAEKTIPRRSLMSTVIASMLAVLVPWLVVYHLIPPTRLPLPVTDAPLVDILLLSYPRPVPVETSVAIINSTIVSYLPYLSPAVSLSLFTHTTGHDALVQVYESLSDSRVTLHVDDDSHPGDVNGHYLHLAEAFRWWSEDKEHQAEWVMLVEDDFTICDGDKGWAVITTVMNKLEMDRRDGHTRSGFIGTGGRYVHSLRLLMPTSPRQELTYQWYHRPSLLHTHAHLPSP